MVRGPMIAEVTPGWLIAQASASSIIVTPDFSASTASSSTTSSLRWFAAVLMSNRALGRAADAGGPGAPLRPPAGEPATGQRAVDEGSHAVTLRCREDVLLDAADEDRVRGLLGDEPCEVPLAGRPLRLDDLAGRGGGRADVADLALVHEVGQRAEGVLDVCRRARAVYLVKIDVVRLQATQ